MYYASICFPQEFLPQFTLRTMVHIFSDVDLLCKKISYRSLSETFSMCRIARMPFSAQSENTQQKSEGTPNISAAYSMAHLSNGKIHCVNIFRSLPALNILAASTVYVQQMSPLHMQQVLAVYTANTLHQRLGLETTAIPACLTLQMPSDRSI